MLFAVLQGESNFQTIHIRLQNTSTEYQSNF